MSRIIRGMWPSSSPWSTSRCSTGGSWSWPSPPTGCSRWPWGRGREGCTTRAPAPGQPHVSADISWWRWWCQVWGGQSGLLSLWRGRERGQVKLYTVCGFIKCFFVGQIVNLIIAAIFIFLPLIVTIAINSCISVKLVMRETVRAEEGCAGCRLGTRGHQGQACSAARSERANFDRIVKMKTVRMTAITALCFVVCQVSSSSLY